MRVPVVVLGVQAHELHQLLDLALDLVPRHRAVQAERGPDDGADRLARVQRGVRVLEDHLHVSTQLPELAPLEVRDVLAVEPDLALRRIEEPHHDAGERRLAAPGLADQAERLAGVDLQVHAVDRVHVAHAMLDQDPRVIGKYFLIPSILMSGPPARPASARSARWLRRSSARQDFLGADALLVGQAQMARGCVVTVDGQQHRHIGLADDP